MFTVRPHARPRPRRGTAPALVVLPLLAALTALAPRPAHAQQISSQIQGQFDLDHDAAGDTLSYSVTDQGGTPLSRTDQFTDAVTGATARVVTGALTEYGFNQVYAEASAGFATRPGGARVDASAQAEAASFWRDVLVIDRPGLTGQTGTLSLSFLLTGTFAGTTTPFSFLDFAVQKDGQALIVREFTAGTAPNPAGEVFSTGPVSFVYGTPFTLDVDLYAVTIPFTGQDGDAPTGRLDFRGGARLTDIVVDGGSGAPGGTQLRFASNAPYSGTAVTGAAVVATVPEPGAALLSGVGLLTLAGGVRRQRRR